LTYGATGEEFDAEPQIDRAAELQEQWKTERGQVWQLGEHRLMCGDSTSAQDVARLMEGQKAALVYTDPPYGVGYSGGTVERDKLNGDKSPDLYLPALRLAVEHTIPEAAVYVWHSDSKSAAVSAAVSAAGLERRCTIIWNKNQAQFGALGAQYKTKHEPCYYLFKRNQTPNWYGPTNEVSVWDVAREASNDFHPTQKPSELGVRAMKNSSQAGEIVFDLFAGSGSTIIAAEQLNRRCFAMEIEPKYVAVCLQRFIDATGKEVKCLTAASV
jgi:DNA modification methylase